LLERFQVESTEQASDSPGQEGGLAPVFVVRFCFHGSRALP
jgi:hypothetical protein